MKKYPLCFNYLYNVLRFFFWIPNSGYWILFLYKESEIIADLKGIA